MFAAFVFSSITHHPGAGIVAGSVNPAFAV
jgi:hypothetical protein